MTTEIQSTIQDLNLYIKVKRKEMTWFLYVNMDTTAKDIKKMMKQFVQRKIHDMQLVVPRYNNRKFNDSLSIEKMILNNGETIYLLLRMEGSENFETVQSITGSYDTTLSALLN